MTANRPPRARILALAILVAGPVAAQDSRAEGPRDKEQYVGSELYRTYCAACHGPSVKGDGVLADRLRVRPPDLTLIAKRNDGKWDADKVERIIDGRDPVKGHGGPDMPAWGDALKGAQDGRGEESVKERIKAIVDYLAMQQETGGKPQK